MSTDKNQTVHPVTDSVLIGHEGLTKREYFAAMAMQRLVAHGSTKDEVDIKYMITDRAVKIADELIKSLNQQQPHMRNNKKIGGFKTPLFKILSTDETRESLRYAKIHNGYVYASNGVSLIKQSLQDFHLITPEECKLIEGKTFHFDLLKQLWAFQQVHFEENKIVAYQGSSASEFEYSTQIVSPDFESVLLYSFGDSKSVKLNDKELKKLFAVMDFDFGPRFVFGGENKAVTICNHIDELHIQHAIIMPVVA